MSTDGKSKKGAAGLERVLVVDSFIANARLMKELLRNVSLCQIYHAPSTARALAMAPELLPQIIFAELSADGVDGLDFTRKLRRSDYLCREAPVIITTATATAASILAARDAGVHEFLRRPFTMGDLLKRIDAVTLKKRDWVEAVEYIGPDRRRFNSAAYEGPRKRRADKGTPETQRLGQALKIVRSALGAIEQDPKQVVRALKAQADCLSALALANPKLQPVGAAARGLQLYLEDAVRTGRLSREALERHGAEIFAAVPAEMRADDAGQKSARAA